ncbi:MAG: phage terminase large subunit [Candidatus Pacearchaeota archaeon]|jgi:predicted phage terminase large subunit-like protein
MIKTANEFKNEFNCSQDIYDAAIYAIRLEDSFYEFYKEAWCVLHDKSIPLIKIPLVKILCDHLQTLYDWHAGKITDITFNRIAIAVPPGLSKSLSVCVAFPAWVWTKEPSAKFMSGSYNESFATRDARRTRDLIKSEWYQYLWGDVFKIKDDQDSKKYYENDCGGERLAFGTRGTFTGIRCDFALFDDPLKIQDAYSKLEREKIGKLVGNAHTRFKNPQTGVIVVIQQRLHVDDPIGRLLNKKNEKWDYLCMPMECDPSIRCKTQIFEDKRKDGECLWPERFTKDFLKAEKESMGSRDYNAQIQQHPESESGSIIHREWFRYYKELPAERKFRIQAYDTAFKIKKTSDYSSCITIDYIPPYFYIVGYWREKVEMPELKRKIQNLYAKYNPDQDILEDKASAPSAVQELKRYTTIPFKLINPQGNKESRCYAVSPTFEAGKILFPDVSFYPEAAEWLIDFEDHLVRFPSETHDDDVDALTLGIIYLKDKFKQPKLYSL